MIFSFLQLSTNILYYRPYWILRHVLLRHSDVHRYGYVPENNESDKIRTGDSMDRLASLNSIPPTWRSFVLLSRKFKFLGCYTNNSIRYVGPAEIFPSFLSCCDLETECLSILWKSNWYYVFNISNNKFNSSLGLLH